MKPSLAVLYGSLYSRVSTLPLPSEALATIHTSDCQGDLRAERLFFAGKAPVPRDKSMNC